MENINKGGVRRSLRLSKKQALERGEDFLQPEDEERELPANPTRVPESTDVMRSGECSKGSIKKNKYNSKAGKKSNKLSNYEVVEAELEAAEALADLKLQRLQIEEERIQKRLELQKQKILSSRKSLSEVSSAVSTHCNIKTWLENQNVKNSKIPQIEFEDGEERNSKRKSSEWMTRMWLNKDLPDFYGHHEEWPNFISMFQESTRLCAFTNAENIYRLRKCLKGKAKETVENMLVSPDNLSIVIKMLERRFGRSDHIIENLMYKAELIPVTKFGNPNSLIDFANIVRNMVATMKTLNCQQYLLNPVLLKKLVNKLPEYLQTAWGETLMQHNTVNLEDFADWIDERADAASYLTTYKSTPDDKLFKKKEAVYTTVQDKKYNCIFCEKSNHTIENCRNFKNENVNRRWNWAKEKKICFSCLKRNHQASQCQKKKICNLNGCVRLHHKLLHNEEIYANRSKFEDQDQNTSHAEKVNHSTYYGNRVLLRILPVILQGPHHEIETYALLDEGSTVTLLDTKIAETLGLQGVNDPLSLQWTNSMTKRDENSRRVTFKIRGKNLTKNYEIQNARTVDNLALPTQSVNMKQLQRKWQHLNYVDISSFQNSQPTLLIGQDNCDIIVARDIVEGPKNGPIATRTKLGWVLHGNLSMFKTQIKNEPLLHHKEIEDNDTLHQLVKDSFKTESFGVKIINENPRSKEDLRAQKIMDLISKRIRNRWETGLLWKRENTELPESKKNAFKRLRFIEKKMDQDPQYTKAYEEKIQDYIKKNYLKKLNKEEIDKDCLITWYLPHFAVTNPNKPKKIRIVYDAAAKSNGVSLNDNLVKGPDLLCSLIGVLIKFRQIKIGFGADIREMFHQVRIREEDCPAQRILWRGMRREAEPDVYELKVMNFGATCSPCLAQEIKNKNAKEFEKEYPEAVNAILKRHYVDDYFDSTHNEEQAIKQIKDVIEVHRRGGFEIRNWVCTSKSVLKLVPEEHVAETSKEIKIQTEIQMERVLGIHWNPHEDIFRFNLKLHKINQDILDKNKNPTKREFLRIIMSIFDPLGFLANFMISSKILLQDIWRSQIGWDDELPQELNKRWEKLLLNFQIFEDIKIPRCYSINMEHAKNIQLHIFCDASEKAFGAVAYLRIESLEEINTSFIMSRTRVSPLRPMSIPRLELQAAVMASRMGNTILKELEININSIHYWTDSQTVLCWIVSDAKKFKSFVAHRVGEICELTDVSSWHWISTKDNVADQLTRDIEINLVKYEHWLYGPTFLKHVETDWPKKKQFNEVIIEEEHLELRPNYFGIMLETEKPSLPDIRRFYSWLKLIRATAWSRRFVKICLRQKNKENSLFPVELTVPELKNAEYLCWKRIQTTKNGTYRSPVTKIILLK